jgi:hypothetical protein
VPPESPVTIEIIEFTSAAVQASSVRHGEVFQRHIRSVSLPNDPDKLDLLV